MPTFLPARRRFVQLAAALAAVPGAPAVSSAATANIPGKGKPVAGTALHWLDGRAPARFEGATFGVPWPRGTLRLGAYPCVIRPGTTMERCYGTLEISERHRHRYEFNNDYREALTSAGLVLSGLSPDGRLVETVELTDQPFFVGVQYHPEFKSRPNHAHPLFRGLVGAALERQKASRLFEVPEPADA